MTDRILVPIDGSPLSWRALETALEEYPDADVVALHVVDPNEPGYSVYGVPFDNETEPLRGSGEWYERAHGYADDLFEEAREIAAEYDADLETETVVGDPAREIVEYAVDNDVDQIVAGSHGRDEDTRLLLGSVSESIAFRAPMRVSLIR